ncbi:chemotaxis protein CheW [bacterium]|nr:chemotaxis protein CheW [bacterium]
MYGQKEMIKESGQLVTFRVGKEVYGIDIFRIQEVIHLRKINAIPNSPDFVEGVIEVRDMIVPVVDLKKRLNIHENGSANRRIVILDLQKRLLGIIVDEIYKVLLLEQKDYETLPDAVLGDRERSCVSRLAKTQDGLINIITPERILSRGEMDALDCLKDLDKKGPVDA